MDLPEEEWQRQKPVLTYEAWAAKIKLVEEDALEGKR